jgi:uncharacterized membrane protein
MGKLRPNWFAGIRTPWTLSSRESWEKTHRLGGHVFVAIGLAIVVVGLLRAEWAVTATLVLLLVGGLGLIVYSYLVWRDDPNKTPPGQL